ncbi:MAG TPA: hypothetical protein VEB20_05485 [Azospirillaceae bacterium]|nr:hypothetical protein [Azospirillaceae bacterium]
MRELRAISFTERELTTAIIEFSGRLRRQLPSGTVQDAVLLPGPPITARLPIQDDYGTLHQVDYAEMEVAAALVHYCMSRKIRMPAKSEKVLQVIAGQATLVIWVGQTKNNRMTRPAAPARAAR